MNIIAAIQDEHLFRSFLETGDGDLDSWRKWGAALRAVYGLPIRSDATKATIRQCTGRDPAQLPREGFSTALFLTGRRSGKSRTAAVIGAFEASLAEHQQKLSKGEKGIVAIIAPTKSQSRIVHGYLRAIFDVPLLKAEVVNETKEGFELRNGTRIEILAGDFRTIRGFTLLAAIVDEIAFFGLDDEAKIKSDTELVRAIKPSLATVRGKLICISSPYARKGWCWKQYKHCFGNDASKTLVWNAPSRVMNETLPQEVVDEAMADDPQAAKSEYLGEFRDDVAAYLPESVIRQLVIAGRKQLLPRKHKYTAFCDVSGGRADDATLAIAHLTGRKVIVDHLLRYRPPFSPQDVVSRMAKELRDYGVRHVTGDNYAAEFVAQAFSACGIHYTKSEKPKAALYLELLPRLCSGEIELPDDDVLVGQLASLERRTRSGGRDIIDHPPGGHDDLANAIAGVAAMAAQPVLEIGAMF